MIRNNVEIKYTKPFIDGAYCEESFPETFPVYCPIDGSQIAEVASCGPEYVDRAVEAAKAALPVWNSYNAEKKGVIMRRVAEEIRKRSDWIGELETLNTGIPIATTKGHFADRSAAFFEYFSAIPDKMHGRTVPIEPGLMSMTIHEPLGVVGILLPWNAPFTEMCLATAASIACGNTTVIKPASFTPLTALIFGEICNAAGVPKGVINIVTGPGDVVGARMARHPGIAKVSFTGSNAAGKRVMANTVDTVKMSTLELGGKAPVIVCKDADLEYAAAQASFSAVRNSGQICTAATRLYIPESIADKFTDMVLEKMKTYQIGDPFDPNTVLGPMISKKHQQQVLGFIERGKADGAKLLLGGGTPTDLALRDGYFVNPALFTNVRHDSELAQEEIFGPVLCLFTYKTLEEAVAMANDVRYGLAASIFTSSIKNAMYFLSHSEAGLNWVNCINLSHPAITHGGFKESGLGIQNGMDSVLFSYTRIKTVWINKNV